MECKRSTYKIEFENSKRNGTNLDEIDYSMGNIQTDRCKKNNKKATVSVLIIAEYCSLVLLVLWRLNKIGLFKIIGDCIPKTIRISVGCSKSISQLYPVSEVQLQPVIIRPTERFDDC